MATLSTFIGLPVSITLGVLSLAGASVSGVATTLTSKHEKKLVKDTKLVDTVTSAIAVFKTSVYKASNNDEIDEREFGILQELHLKVVNELTILDHKMKAETRHQLKELLLEEINEIKETLRTRDAS